MRLLRITLIAMIIFFTLTQVTFSLSTDEIPVFHRKDAGQGLLLLAKHSPELITDKVIEDFVRNNKPPLIFNLSQKDRVELMGNEFAMKRRMPELKQKLFAGAEKIGERFRTVYRFVLGSYDFDKQMYDFDYIWFKPFGVSGIPGIGLLVKLNPFVKLGRVGLPMNAEEAEALKARIPKTPKGGKVIFAEAVVHFKGFGRDEKLGCPTLEMQIERFTFYESSVGNKNKDTDSYQFAKPIRSFSSDELEQTFGKK